MGTESETMRSLSVARETASSSITTINERIKIGAALLPIAANSNSPAPEDDDPTPAAPGARVPVPIEEAAEFKVLASFVRGQLPVMNMAIRRGKEDVQTLIFQAREFVAPGALSELVPSLDPQSARTLLQHLGFIASSVERHHQQVGGLPGAGVAAIEGLTPVLTELGRIGKHPPRDSYLTYWLMNSGSDPLTFTGDPQEHFFNFAVNQTAAKIQAALDHTRWLRVGDLHFDFDSAADALDAASLEILALVGIYRDFRRSNPTTGKRNLEPDFFMLEMRQYLLSYLINGENVHGPNATYSPAWALCDLALGNRDLRFIDVLCKRRPWTIDEDWQAISADFALASIPEVLIARLGSTVPNFLTMEDAEVRKLVSTAGPGALRVMQSYSRLADGHRMLSAIHWSLIVNYLLKPSEQMDSSTIGTMPVKPSQGVSATPVEATRTNDKERRANVLNRKFMELYPYGPSA